MNIYHIHGKIIRFVSGLLVILLINNVIHAEDIEDEEIPGNPHSAALEKAYLIPRQIYVGDPAALVLPLPGARQNSDDIILIPDLYNAYFFPSDPDIDFHRIILERRVSESKLTVEFTAFVPGIHEFPVIIIGGEYFEGLTVTVNSILDDDSRRILSSAAPALAMPGTALLLYGSMAVLVFLILFTIWFFVKGRTALQELRKNWKRRILFISIKNTEKQLYKAFLKGADKRMILDKLSGEFKNFLSILTDNNCSAMTACELETLPHEYFLLLEDSHNFLGNFFRSCDELRFSGVVAGSDDITRLLDNLRIFIGKLENIKKKKQMEEKAA
ncbi:MAG: hypothetical protein FWD13_02120 [Treponema sp.]|nr:hypothetical protein [Treponema sp.]